MKAERKTRLHRLAGAAQSELDAYVKNTFIPLADRMRYGKKTQALKAEWNTAGLTIEALRMKRDAAFNRRQNRRRFTWKYCDQMPLFG